MEKLISALIILTFAVSAPAAVIYVDANGTGDYTTIQAAIDDANDGDIILLSDGIYTGVGNRDIDFLGKAIMVLSENGPENCIIDCNGTYDQNHRGFYFVNSEGTNSVLQGFTIKNAHVVVMCEGGAGIYIKDTSPTIKECMVINNYAELLPESLCFCYGGGIYIGDGSSPSITNCIISDNSVGNWGFGGGIYCEYEADATIIGCLISNNTALGIYGAGGGIYCDYLSDSSIINCTITDNLASDEGGGIYAYAYDGSSAGTIANSIIWDNSPDQIYTHDINSLIVRCSDIEGGWLSPAPGPGGHFLSSMDSDPCFINLDADNYRLKSNSPCIDTGCNSYVPGDLTEDLDGRDRIVDGDCNDTDVVDMGAYEFTGAYLGDFAGGCDVDFQDFAVIALTWSKIQGQDAYDPDCDVAIPLDRKVDTKDLKVLIDNWLSNW